jgi:hypothetical protein
MLIRLEKADVRIYIQEKEMRKRDETPSYTLCL